METKLKLKRNSLFLLYLLSLLLAGVLFTPSHLSTNMMAIFKHDENIEKLKIMNSFEKSTTLFVSIEGFSKENRQKLLQIEKDLKKFDFITKTTFNTSKIEISNYLKKNYYLLSDFNNTKLDNKTIEHQVKALKQSLVNSFFYTPIDKNDPLKLFKFNLTVSKGLTKNSFLALGERGYLLTAELNATLSNMKEAQAIEAKLTNYFKEKKEILVFSTLFFTAQNSKIIKSSVQTILYLSFFLLILLFFITLRDHKLLLANTLSLGSSIFFALALSTYIFKELSIFVLAFGSAISSMSVDYLFHNYFHGQYKKRGINYSILWAFLSTILGFFMLSFVDFPLIQQLAIFAILSLSFSYFQFTFLYPYLQLELKEKRVNILKFVKFKPIMSIPLIFVFSIVVIVYAGFNLHFDYNFKHLDYDNQPLRQKQTIIEAHMPKKQMLLIEASSVNALITKAHQLKKLCPSTNSLADFTLTQKVLKEKLNHLSSYDFTDLRNQLNQVANRLGFKENYFRNSYLFVDTMPKSYSANLNSLKKLGYEVIKQDNKFYTLASFSKFKEKSWKTIEGVSLIDASTLLKSSMKKMFNNLLFYLFISFLSIVILVLFIVREKAILALNFILFPMAIILLYLSFVQINIMHLFSMIVIVVAGIDYGIYMSKENSLQTSEAILYSVLTTFSGFGILVVSSIGAIHSIGMVISMGILSILFLILFMKTQN